MDIRTIDEIESLANEIMITCQTLRDGLIDEEELKTACQLRCERILEIVEREKL